VVDGRWLWISWYACVCSVREASVVCVRRALCALCASGHLKRAGIAGVEDFRGLLGSVVGGLPLAQQGQAALATDTAWVVENLACEGWRLLRGIVKWVPYMGSPLLVVNQ
jgi:hypothetical protein